MVGRIEPAVGLGSLCTRLPAFGEMVYPRRLREGAGEREWMEINITLAVMTAGLELACTIETPMFDFPAHPVCVWYEGLGRGFDVEEGCVQDARLRNLCYETIVPLQLRGMARRSMALLG